AELLGPEQVVLLARIPTAVDVQVERRDWPSLGAPTRQPSQERSIDGVDHLSLLPRNAEDQPPSSLDGEALQLHRRIDALEPGVDDRAEGEQELAPGRHQV